MKQVDPEFERIVIRSGSCTKASVLAPWGAWMTIDVSWCDGPEAECIDRFCDRFVKMLKVGRP